MNGCSCITDVNRDIAEHNAVLVTTMFRKPADVAVIGTEKLDTKKRGRPPVMLATFCPFCGVRYEEAA